MANSIELRKIYTENLDEVYKLASITSVLDGPSELAKAGANAHEILIPKMDMDGLADYDKALGYSGGSVTYEFETKEITYDRGRKFNVDAVDDMDTMNQAFGRLAGEFMRTKVVPELDSWRLSQYAQATPSANKAYGTLDTGKKVIDALRAAKIAIKEQEADISDCILYINPTCKGLVEDMDSYASRAAMEGFAGIVEVPTNRFQSKIKLTSNGYEPDTGSQDIDFLIIPKKAVIQFQKHDVPKIIKPEDNQEADGYMFMYRTVGIAEVYDNKKVAIYLHTPEQIV